METKYLGSNVVVTLVDKPYDLTKEFDSDGDDGTASVRLNASELLALQTQLAVVLGINLTQTEAVLTKMQNSTIGEVTMVLKPNQFASIMLYVQDFNYINIRSYKPELSADYIDLSGDTYLR
jgi:hypothetical protein